MAARRGNSELCDLLLKLASMNAAAISQANSKGWGGLHMAALSGSATTCEMLLRLGADKDKVATVHQIDGSPSSMTPEALAKHLHEHDSIYARYCAGNEFGRVESPRAVTAVQLHVAERSRSRRASEKKESLSGAEGEGDTKATHSSHFEGVMQVFDGGVNPEDAHAVYSSEVVNIITQFNRCGF